MAAIIDISDVLTWLGMGASATRAQRAKIEFLIPFAEDAVKQDVGYSILQATHTQFLPERDLTVDDTEQFDVVNDRVLIQREGQDDALFLPERPVRSITSVNEDIGASGGQGASDFSGANLTSGTDYYIDNTVSGVSWNGRLVKKFGTWSYRRRTVKVVYVAGFTAAELDAGTIRGPEGGSILSFKMAAVLATSAWYLESNSFEPSSGYVGPVVSERLRDRSVTYSTAQLKQLSMTMGLPQKSRELLKQFKRYSY